VFTPCRDGGVLSFVIWHDIREIRDDLIEGVSRDYCSTASWRAG